MGLNSLRCWQESTLGVGSGQIFGALLNTTDWINYPYLDRLVREQASGVRNHRYLLLLLAALDQWLRLFIQGKVEAPTWKWSSCFESV